MTGIVERLRTRNGRPDGFGMGPVCDEAADAIERLHEQIAEQKRMIETYLADITGDQAEIARLRDLLRLASCGATAERQPSVAPAAIEEDAARYRWLAAHARSTTEHWGGRWSLVIEGPAPRKHDEEDALDEAVDAAMRVHRERFDDSHEREPHDER